MTSLPARLWRCFHCDEVFTDKDAARLHFGDSELSDSACQIDVEKYREMERLHERDLAEDTDKDRAIYRMQSDHGVALRREEEKGYARGLRDAGYEVQQNERLETALRVVLSYAEAQSPNAFERINAVARAALNES